MGTEVNVQKFNVDVWDGNTNITCRFLFGEEGLTGLWADAGFHFVRIDVKSILNKFDKEDTISTSNGFWQIPQEMDVRINFSSKEIVYSDATISNFRSNIYATEKKIEIDNLYSDLPFGNIQMDLLVSDYKNDKINYNADVNLLIDSLDIDKLLKMKALGIPAQKFKSQEPATSNKKNPLLGLPDNINLKLNTSAKYISYKNAIVEDLILQITSNNEKLDLEKLDYKFAGGKMNIHGQLTMPNSSDHLKWSDEYAKGYLYSKADSIDIQKFFISFDNFGQNVFTADNSSGKISWASHYYFDLDEDYKLKKDDDLWLINAIVYHAEFDKVEPIEKTLFFIGHKAKDNMIVSKLDVNAFMFGNKIYFSDVLMNDNIANLDVFGEVDLNEKELDLGLEISLSDLFFRSKKERLAETQEGIVNLDKDAKLFLRMTGSFSDHKLKMISKRKFNKNREYLLDDIKTAEGEFRKRRIR
ncbi:MAG: AsmA family protein [Bacteroidales bacterium]|nr:AsmA family protein [Bacteroidales bacterium]